jgi:hypothetical protein
MKHKHSNELQLVMTTLTWLTACKLEDNIGLSIGTPGSRLYVGLD